MLIPLRPALPHVGVGEGEFFIDGFGLAIKRSAKWFFSFAETDGKSILDGTLGICLKPGENLGPALMTEPRTLGR